MLESAPDENSFLYSRARLYDLVMGVVAEGALFEFWKEQIVRYGQPALEIACGTGRITIPLSEAGADIAGLDISQEMLKLAREKASSRDVQPNLICADARRFQFRRGFPLIFFPANSLQHMLHHQDLSACLSCVREHLSEGGRFIFDIYNPSLPVLMREADQRYEVGEYEDSVKGGRVTVTSSNSYDAATQINHIHYFYHWRETSEEETLSFAMRQYYPQEIEALIEYNGFQIERKYGDLEESVFNSASPKQVIVCRRI